MRVWFCEKHDQAAKLAVQLGNAQKRRGYYETNDGLVTHGIGHLLLQAEPEHYTEQWAKWSFDALPMIPAEWQRIVDPEKKNQLAIVLDCLKSATEVVIATDPDPEGEAIAREVLEHARYRGPIRRFWSSSLDPASLMKALAHLRDGAETEPLYFAAVARAQADWLIGMNMTRAYTLRARATGGDGVRSVGRVQTPTLALVVRRDREIENFTIRTYYELTAEATTAAGECVTLKYAPAEADRITNRAAAEALAQRVNGATGPLIIETNARTTAPPRPLSLGALQKAASHKLGWSAAKTLDVAQSLYEKGVTSYPRTGCRYLPNEQERQIPAVLDALARTHVFARHIAALTVHGPTIRSTVFNTAEVNKEPHHAIAPTTVPGADANLTTDEAAAYVLIAQHYLAALLPDYRYNETTIAFDANGVPFRTAGRVPLSPGWKAVFGEDADDDSDNDKPEDNPTLPAIAPGTRATLAQAALLAKKTRPPKRYTEGDLIADMESVAKFATDPAIRARLKESSGIGTDATRSDVIKTLRARTFLEPQGKFIVSTTTGREHIDAIAPALTDAAMTALWEERLDAIRKGQLDVSARAEFVTKIGANVTRLIDALRGESAQLAVSRRPSETQTALAHKVADSLGLPLPDVTLASHGALSAFLSEHLPAFRALPPSPAQVTLAKKLAGEKGFAVPADIATSREACRAFIDAHAIVKGASNPAKASERRKRTKA